MRLKGYSLITRRNIGVSNRRLFVQYQRCCGVWTNAWSTMMPTKSHKSSRLTGSHWRVRDRRRWGVLASVCSAYRFVSTTMWFINSSSKNRRRYASGSVLSASVTCNPGFPVKGKRGGGAGRLAESKRHQTRASATSTDWLSETSLSDENSSDDKFADSSLSQYTKVSESELTSNAKLLIPDSLLRSELDMTTFYINRQQKDRQAFQEGGRCLEMLISSHWNSL